MSTQSPTPPTPKGPRNNTNNRRNQKKNTTPYTQKATLLTTPPSSPPRNLSPGGTATDSSNNFNLSKKKNNNGRSGKKPRDMPKASPAQNNAHRYTPSHPNTTTPQMKEYAGPTFHASPAPSALPMPSFFSKSVPDPDLAPAIETDSDNLETEPEPDFESTPSKPKSRSPCNGEQSESTPLDFLFKAAVEARNNAQRSPEASARVRSPQTDSKVLPRRKPNGVSGGMFPLEMENSDMYGSQIGPSFAPSYKDRMDALRSASSPQHMSDVDEGRRRAKTEELKSLLLNPRPQRPSSASPMVVNQVSGFNGHPSASPNMPHFATPLRTTSGPPATISHGISHDPRQPPVGNGVHYSYPYTQTGNPYQVRAERSPFRREVSSSSGNMANFSGAKLASPYAPYNQSNFANIYPQHPVYGSPTGSRAMPAAHPSSQALDTKKMEDDLRRILKLDGNPGIPSGGVQSSFA